VEAQIRMRKAEVEEFEGVGQVMMSLNRRRVGQECHRMHTSVLCVSTPDSFLQIRPGRLATCSNFQLYDYVSFKPTVKVINIGDSNGQSLPNRASMRRCLIESWVGFKIRIVEFHVVDAESFIFAAAWRHRVKVIYVSLNYFDIPSFEVSVRAVEFATQND